MRKQKGAVEMDKTPRLGAVAFASIVAISFIATDLAQAASATGTWLRPKTGAHVKAFACGNGLGLKIMKARKKETVGTVIMCSAKKTAPNKWQGDLKSTEDGNIYSGTVTINGTKLRLEGCAFAGLICKTEVWKRLN